LATGGIQTIPKELMMTNRQKEVDSTWQFRFEDDLPENVSMKEYSDRDRESVVLEAQIWSTNGAGNLPNGLHVLKK